MKFVKEHLVVLICAAVALLLVIAAFVYPIPSMIKAQQDAIKQRLALRQTIKQLAMTKLALPGLPEVQGIPSEEYIQAKKDSIQAIDNAKKAVSEMSWQYNMKGRVENNVPILPIPGRGKPEPGFLPRRAASAEPNQYKADYNSQFRLWTAWLSKGTPADAELDSAVPPDPNAVRAQFDQDQQARTGGPASPVMAMVNGNESDELLAFEKRQVMNRAAELRMYVERTAFQIRPWAVEDRAPSETEIFESLVDSWLQSDVVKAIVETNQAGNPGPKDHAIARSAVKRLTRIVIGNNARLRVLSSPLSPTGGMSTPSPTGSTPQEPGALFLLTSNATSGNSGPVMGPAVSGGGGAPAEDEQAPANEIHYELGMSGRSGGKDYDIVMMNVLVDIDPAKLNAFIDALYRQNPGYTVSSVQLKTVDPLDRASSGYLYGEDQVVEAEIQVECMFFRKWTRPLMTDDESALLGLAPYKAPAPENH